jgi:hypothetical protein
VIDSICLLVNSWEVGDIVKEELVALFLPDVFFHSVRHVINTLNTGKSIKLRLFTDVFLIDLMDIHQAIFSSSHEILFILVKLHGCDSTRMAIMHFDLQEAVRGF